MGVLNRDAVLVLQRHFESICPYRVASRRPYTPHIGWNGANVAVVLVLQRHFRRIRQDRVVSRHPYTPHIGWNGANVAVVLQPPNRE